MLSQIELQTQINARLRISIGRAICLLTPQHRILPYLNGNHTFNTPMVAMAVTTGLEPAISSVTDWRALQLLHATIFRSYWSLICVYLEL